MLVIKNKDHIISFNLNMKLILPLFLIDSFNFNYKFNLIMFILIKAS